jgi:hypothetical protein
MRDIQQLAELEQQALEYYKEADYSGVVCMLVKAFEGTGLCTSIVPRDKCYEVYVAAASPTGTRQAVIRVYKVGDLQRTFNALVGSNIPTYHVSHDGELVGQPCTLVGAVATVQACFE